MGCSEDPSLPFLVAGLDSAGCEAEMPFKMSLGCGSECSVEVTGVWV